MFQSLLLYGTLAISLSILVDFASKNRKMHFLTAVILSLFLTPILGLILVFGSARKYPKGCLNCGNAENEAEYCALCMKNVLGEFRPDLSKIEDQLRD